MKVRLTQDHYFPYDQYMEAGTVVDLRDPAYGWLVDPEKPKGELKPLSSAMEPLDDEARQALKAQFETTPVDPISALPIHPREKTATKKPYEPPKFVDPKNPSRVPGAGIGQSQAVINPVTGKPFPNNAGISAAPKAELAQ